MKPTLTAFSLALCLAWAGPPARAAMVITEWAYQGNGGEYMEFTNMGGSSVDMTGWSYDDNTEVAGSVDLSSFGVVAPGESVILTDLTAAAFRTEWSLAASVKVIGENLQNLGRADEINLYDNANNRIDWLAYNDQGSEGGPRTNLASANPATLAAVGAHDAHLWILSVPGDTFASRTSANGGVGNPGVFTLVPEPAGALLLGAAAPALLGRSRRRN